MRFSFKLLLFVAFLGTSAFSAPSAADSGTGLAIIPIAADRSAEKSALEVGYIASTGFDRSPNFNVFPIETLLEGQLPSGALAHQEALLKLREAAIAYDALDLTGALSALTQASIAFEKGTSHWDDLEPVVKTYLLTGATHALMGDMKSATAAFQQALTLNPHAQIPTEIMPEIAKPAIEEAHLLVTEAATGRLGIFSSPQMAEVWLDGHYRGVTPLQLDQIPTGRHYLKLVSPGYLNEGRLVEIAPHQEAIVQAAMTPTKMLAQYQQKTAPLKQGDTTAIIDLGQMLKLDRLLILRVQAMGPDITIFGLMVDGVTGDVYQETQKSFSTLSPLFRGEVESWLASSFRKPQYTIPQVKPDAKLTPNDPGYIPPPVAPEGINTQIRSGYIFLTVAGLTLSGAIASAALSLQVRDVFKARPQTQSTQLKTDWFYFALGADIGYSISAVLGGVGIYHLTQGYQKKKQVDDILGMHQIPSLLFFAQGLEE